MDPEATYQEMRELADRILDDNADLHPDDITRLAELVVAFDEWLSRGGFLPSRGASAPYRQDH